MMPEPHPTSSAAAEGATGGPLLLLLEPHLVTRRTIALTASGLRLARVEESSSLDDARGRLDVQPYDALLLAIDDDQACNRLLARVRSGATATRSDVPIAVMVEGCSQEQFDALGRLGVERVLVKPVRVKAALAALSALCAAASAPRRD